MTVKQAQRWLQIVLIASGVVMLLAILVVFTPRNGLDAMHKALGLGTFPDAPIADYLARVASAIFAFAGGLLLIASQDVRRYATLIFYCGLSFPAISLIGLLTAATRHVPTAALYWLAADLVFAFAFGVAAIALLAVIRGQEAQPAAGS